MPAPFERGDLFRGSQNPGIGRPPHFFLQPGLTPQQKFEAYCLVCSQYPAAAYGTTLNSAADVIRTYPAD